MKLLIFFLIVYGFTQIIVESSIFSYLRRVFKRIHPILGTFITCFLCISVWVSMAYSFLVYSPTMDYGLIMQINHTYKSISELMVLLIKLILSDAMLGSAGAWILHCVEIYLLSNGQTERTV